MFYWPGEHDEEAEEDQGVSWVPGDRGLGATPGKAKYIVSRSSSVIRR
jgi:hypothetical protein